MTRVADKRIPRGREAEVFTVLLVAAKPKTPPPGIREKLERNYKWENGSFTGERE